MSIVAICSANTASRASARASRACTSGGSAVPAQSRTVVHHCVVWRVRIDTTPPDVANQLVI